MVETVIAEIIGPLLDTAFRVEHVIDMVHQTNCVHDLHNVEVCDLVIDIVDVLGCVSAQAQI